MSLMLATVVLFLAGCATTFRPWKLSDVQEGMAKDEVVKILGQPDYTEERDDAEYFYYTYREEPAPAPEASMETNEEIERRIGQLNRTLKESKYEVMLVEGKVVNYKEL